MTLFCIGLKLVSKISVRKRPRSIVFMSQVTICSQFVYEKQEGLTNEIEITVIFITKPFHFSAHSVDEEKSPKTAKAGNTYSPKPAGRLRCIQTSRKRVRKSTDTDSTPEGLAQGSNQDSSTNSSSKNIKSNRTTGSASKFKKRRVNVWYASPRRLRNVTNKKSPSSAESKKGKSPNNDDSVDLGSAGKSGNNDSDLELDSEYVSDNEPDDGTAHEFPETPKGSKSDRILLGRISTVSGRYLQYSVRKRTGSNPKTYNYSNSDRSSILDASPPPRKKTVSINLQNWIDNGNYVTTEKNRKLKSGSALPAPASTYSQRAKRSVSRFSPGGGRRTKIR